MNLLIDFRMRVALVATFFGAAVFATAQPPPERDVRRPRPPGDAPRAERPYANPQRLGAPLWEVLSPEQRERLREAMADQRIRMRELAEQTQRVRREFRECLFAEELNEDALRRNTARLAELTGERAMLLARAFSSIRRSLTPEQLERLREMQADFALGQEPRMPEPPLGRSRERREEGPPRWAGPRDRERDPLPPEPGMRESARPRSSREYDRPGAPEREFEQGRPERPERPERPRFNRGEPERDQPPAFREREREHEREQEERPERTPPRPEADRQDRPPAGDGDRK